MKLIIILCMLIYTCYIKACTDSVTSENPLPVSIVGGKTIKVKSCSELLEKIPGLCEKKDISGIKGLCCETCKAVNPKCLDKVTEHVPFTFSGKKITSCQDIVMNLKALCKEHGKKKGICCDSCTGVDTKCVDKLIFYMDGKDKLRCPEYIAQDPCRCVQKKIKKDCCESCQNMGQDIDECFCRDTMSKTNPKPVILKDKNTQKIIVNIQVTDCKDIVNFYAQFCKHNLYGGEGNVCCKSCTGIDPKCADLMLWKADAKKGSTECMGCTCHEIREKSVSLMKKVCKDDLKGINSARGARMACCRQCERVGLMGQPVGAG